jgi:membrane-associated phospholipid phosphatase
MPALDMNMNMNMNMASGTSGAEGRFRARYNTDIFALLADTSNQSVVAAANYPLFHENWDAELRSYMYLDYFLTRNTGWRANYRTVATAGGRKPPQNMSQPELYTEILQILQLALEREDRFSEVIDQDDANGAINYWLGMLKIDPARHPASNLMVRVAGRIGEHVSMCLKGDFRSPRPPQLCPAITPMIDPPATPSFPAGHAVQPYLISYLLAHSLPNLPQHYLAQPPVPPTLTNPGIPTTATTAGTLSSGLLFDLAARVSQNRIVAGIHYPTDIEAGKAVAIACFTDLRGIAEIWGAAATATAPPVVGIRQGVQQEFPQYA